jgi:hypothetical protein
MTVQPAGWMPREMIRSGGEAMTLMGNSDPLFFGCCNLFVFFLVSPRHSSKRMRVAEAKMVR